MEDRPNFQTFDGGREYTFEFMGFPMRLRIETSPNGERGAVLHFKWRAVDATDLGISFSGSPSSPKLSFSIYYMLLESGDYEAVKLKVRKPASPNPGEVAKYISKFPSVVCLNGHVLNFLNEPGSLFPRSSFESADRIRDLLSMRRQIDVEIASLSFSTVEEVELAFR